MRSLDKNADTYLDLCQQFMIKEFDERAILRRVPDMKIMTTSPAPQDGSPIRCFEVGERVWEVVEEDSETNVVITHDGRVSVSYPCQDLDHGGMNFRVGHPREVAELFHLLVYPASCITPNEATAWERRKLGDLADFHVLVPDGTVWRIVDLGNPPKGAPADFLQALYFNVVQDWDKFCMGKAVEAHKIADCWVDGVKTLPEAVDQIKGGYVVSPDNGVCSTVERIANGPDVRQIFLDLLLVPRDKAVSCLYLRELLGRDADTGKAIRNAFSTATNFTTLRDNLAAVELYMPVQRSHQIRLAAEQILINEWLRSVTECLVNARGAYLLQGDRQWHLAHVFRQMIGVKNG